MRKKRRVGKAGRRGWEGWAQAQSQMGALSGGADRREGGQALGRFVDASTQNWQKEG